jgi:peptidoglycan/LPS O-acetylase OafA/YrhL
VKGRLDAIDRLRGLAIALVLIYHAGPLAWRLAPYRSDGWLAWPALGWKWLLVPLLHFGFTGVHAFFVLSGFCIHLRAARTREAPHLRGFFLRRFWRIYPPYWIALAGFAILLRPSVSDFLLHATMTHTLTERSFFSINPAFWSLATEEQFYLAYPLVAWALARLGTRRVLAFALALSLLWRATVLAFVPPTVENFLAWRVLVHGLFLPRWFEWLLGCWLAERVAAGRLGRARPFALVAALLLVAGMATRVHVAVDKLLSDALFAGGYTALTAAALAARPTGVAILARVGDALGALGRRAYGLYLVHQPALDWMALPWIARVLLATVGGWLFSIVCEAPFERRSKAVARAVAA